LANGLNEPFADRTPTVPAPSSSPDRSHLKPATWLGRLAAAILCHPRQTIAAFAVVTVLAVVSATRLTVDPDMLTLLPQDHPTTLAIQRINDEEGGANLVTLAFKGDDPTARDASLGALSQRIETLDGVAYALFDIDPELAWQLGMLQLTPAELTAIETRLQGAVALGPAAANPFVAQRLLDLGPLTQKLASGDRSRAVLPSDDGLARIVVRPTGSPFDSRFAGPFMESLEAEVNAFVDADPAIELVWVGGAYRHSVEDVETIRTDLAATAGLSALLVLTLITLAFRDLRATLLVFVPLIFANLWTTGVAWLTVGSLNTFTSFYPAILVGLGVDFSLHLYARYREERLVQNSVHNAIIAAWDKVGPPCLTAAVTSAGGFCALWVAGFGGFRQLGTLLGAGVLLCLLSVMTMLPLLISWRDGRQDLAALRTTDPKKPVGAIGRGVARTAPFFLLVVAGVSLVASTQVDLIGFEYDLSALRRAGLSYDDISVEERRAAESAFAPVLLSFEDADALAAAHTRLAGPVKAGEVPQVSGLLSIHTVLPVDQQLRHDRLVVITELARHPHIQFLPLAARNNLAALAESSPRMLAASDLPRGLRHVLGGDAARPRMLLMPGGNQWDLRENAKLRESVATIAPEAEAAGEYLALAVLYELVVNDVPWVAGTALLVVFLLSWFDLNHPGRALWTVSALAAGMAWAAAGMVATGIELSVVNFVGIPILMGIGVDVIIHLMHRVEEEGPGGIKRALSTTGWASALSATTTILSFASLTIAEHQGVRSLGYLIVLGLSLVTLGGFAVVPLGWLTIWRLRGQLEDDAEEDRRAKSDTAQG